MIAFIFLSVIKANRETSQNKKIKTIISDNGILTAVCEDMKGIDRIWQMVHTKGDWVEIRTPAEQVHLDKKRSEEVRKIVSEEVELYVPAWMDKTYRDQEIWCKGCGFRGEAIVSYKSLKTFLENFPHMDHKRPIFLSCLEHEGAILPKSGFKGEFR